MKIPVISEIYWQIQLRHIRMKLLSQWLVMPSPFLTNLFLTVSLYLIAVNVTTSVAVDTADVWKLETLASVVYRYSVAKVWITNVVEIQSCLHLFWQSSAWLWIGYNHQWLPGEPIRYLGLPALATFSPPFHLMSNPSFIWGNQDSASMLKWMENGYPELVHWQKNTFSPLRQSWEEVCARAEPTAQWLHWWNSPWVNCLEGQHCIISPAITKNILSHEKMITLLPWRDTYLVGRN